MDLAAMAVDTACVVMIADVESAEKIDAPSAEAAANPAKDVKPRATASQLVWMGAALWSSGTG